MKKLMVVLILVVISLQVSEVVGDPTYPDGYVFGFESNFSNWRDHTYSLPYHYASGGNPDGHFQSHVRAKPWYYPYDSAQAGTSGPLVGNLWQKYGNDFSFTVDIKVATPGVTVTQIDYQLNGNGGWDYTWPGSWTSEDGWITLRAPIVYGDDTGWDNRGVTSWNDVVANATKYACLIGYADDGEAFSLAIDNWGYTPGHTAPPVPPTKALLNYAVAWWQMDTTNDTVGLNSELTVAGNASVGNYAADLNDIGPAANNYYANFPNHTNGDYLNAGQGENNRLQITEAHTFYIRVKFDDLSITQYLFSKYDHAIGPNGQRNRTAYLRAENNTLKYAIGDGTSSAGLAEVTGLSQNTWYDIAAVFDPDSDQIALYVIDPNTRSLLMSDTCVVIVNSIPMDCPVPFTIGDRLTWNGSSWVPVGNSAMDGAVEMAAIWGYPYALQDLQDLDVNSLPSKFALGFCVSTDWLHQTTCYQEMPIWAEHGMNKLYVLKMISGNIIGDLDRYDFIFNIGAQYGIESYPGLMFGMEEPANRQTLIDYAKAHRNMPGMAGYAHNDEPVDNVAYQDFKDVYEMLKKYDPAHAVWCEFTSSIRWHTEWIPYCDIPSAGCYALGWGYELWESTVLARQMRDLAQQAGRKTSTFLLQCADYHNGDLLFPTLEQNRYLSYGPLTVGCDGLLYYSRDAQWIHHPENLDNIIYPVCDELRALDDVLVSDDPVPTVTTNHDRWTTGNQIYGWYVNDITYLVKSYNDDVYIFAVNNKDIAISVTFDLTCLTQSMAGEVNVLYESGRAISLTRNGNTAQFTDSFAGYGTHVYKILASRCGDSEHPYPNGDLSQDCNVNFDDLEMFAHGWLEQYDFLDFTVLAENWQYCNAPQGCQ
ncbi:MAG: hypothetical protein ABIG61_04120 [Planctomycetota bacterium]